MIREQKGHREMSHNVGKMFFTGKKPWWFGNRHQGDAIGTYVGDEAVTSRQAITVAGLDGWNMQTVDSAHWDETKQLWIPVPNEKFIIRGKDGKVQGRCNTRYTPFQNEEAFEFMDKIAGDFGMRYHTAGDLEGGKRVWILGQLPGEIKIGRLSGVVNTHLAFFLMILGHDGVSSINGMPTDVRAECANTCGYAQSLADAKGLSFSVPHTANAKAKLELAAAALSKVPAAMAQQEILLQELARRPMTTEEFIEFATSVFLEVDSDDKEEIELHVARWYEGATNRSKTILENKVARLAKFFHDRSHGNEGSTEYDAVQAFTAADDHPGDHVRKQIDKAKRIAQLQGIGKSSWIGAGAKRKALVYKRLRGGGVAPA